MIALLPNEKILHTVRRHGFIFALEAATFIILMLLPLSALIFPGVKGFLNTSFVVTGNIFTFCLFLYSIWVLVFWLLISILWTDYYLDAWVVTDLRLIDIDQRGLFNRKISAVRHDMIQDVTIKIPGVLATFIKYGDIQVQTAGETAQFEFKGVADPEGVKAIILAEHHRAHDLRRQVEIRQ